MATIFPDTNDSSTAPDPSTGWVVGDQFTTAEGVVYTWTGYSWTTDSSGGGIEYLPLTGGELTGSVTSSSTITTQGAITAAWNTNTTGGKTALGAYGNLYIEAANPNAIDIRSTDDTATSVIALNKNGSITAAGQLTTNNIDITHTDASAALVIRETGATAASILIEQDGTATVQIDSTGAAFFAGGKINLYSYGGSEYYYATSTAGNTLADWKTDVVGTKTSVVKFDTDGAITAAGNITAQNCELVGFFKSQRANSGDLILQGVGPDGVGVTIRADGSIETKPVYMRGAPPNTSPALQVGHIWGSAAQPSAQFGYGSSTNNDFVATTTINRNGSATFSGTVTANGSVLTRASGNLDVGDRLEKADAALQTLKTAAAASTDFASLKAAIATALANI